VRRLGAADVAELIRGRYRLSHSDANRLLRHLEERGEGNPFYLGEILRSFEEDGVLRAEADGWTLGDVTRERVPRLLRQVIDSRLARLGDDARRHLAIAAVIGQEVPLALWADVAAIGEETLLLLVERAVEGRILDDDVDGTRVRFSHALLREALYESLLSARKRSWHGRVAGELAADPDSDPVTVAYHFRQAGDSREIEWLVRSGARARALYVPRLAIDHLTRALELAAKEGRQPPLTAYRERGLAFLAAGNFPAARSDLETALTLAGALGDRRGEWQALLDLGFAWEGQNYQEVGSYLRRALDQARLIGEPRCLAQSLNRLGNWHLNLDEPTEGTPYHFEALDLFRSLGDQSGIATTLDHLGSMSVVAADLIRSTVYFREAARLADRLGDKQTLASVLSFLAFCASSYGCEALAPALTLDEALTIGEQAVEVAGSLDSPTSDAFARFSLAHCLAHRGEYRRALAETRRGLELAERSGHGEWMADAHTIIGAILLDLFAVTEAREHLERGLSLALEVSSRYWRGFISGTLALACIAGGDFARADQVTTAGLSAETSALTATRRTCVHARSVLALAQGDAARALVLVDRLLAAEPIVPHDRHNPRLLFQRAEALARLGRFAEAEPAFQLTRGVTNRIGVTRLSWQVDAAMARLLCDQGRASEADRYASTARGAVTAIADGLDDASLRASFLAGALRQIPDTSGFKTRPLSSQFGLSAREEEVLRLLAEGLSNAEIADRLTVSVRTINTHLTNVYAKLGVATRSAAVRYAIDHGLA
jgi:DNA-binding CsgD family transcriptional regulator/tetratricopeptide (TPR) repeat protein